jgi:hypothetical protein
LKVEAQAQAIGHPFVNQLVTRHVSEMIAANNFEFMVCLSCCSKCIDGMPLPSNEASISLEWAHRDPA